jgi:hypothetical protein
LYIVVWNAEYDPRHQFSAAILSRFFPTYLGFGHAVYNPIFHGFQVFGPKIATAVACFD